MIETNKTFQLKKFYTSSKNHTLFMEDVSSLLFSKEIDCKHVNTKNIIFSEIMNLGKILFYKLILWNQLELRRNRR